MEWSLCEGDLREIKIHYWHNSRTCAIFRLVHSYVCLLAWAWKWESWFIHFWSCLDDAVRTHFIQQQHSGYLRLGPKFFWSFYLDSQSDDPGLVFSDCKLKFWKYTSNHYNRTRVFGTRYKVYLGLSKYELSHFRRHWTYVRIWFQWAFNVIIMS